MRIAGRGGATPNLFRRYTAVAARSLGIGQQPFFRRDRAGIERDRRQEEGRVGARNKQREGKDRGNVRRIVVKGQRFWLAVQFLTRLPVPRGVAYDPAAFHATVGYFPLVGLVLGLSYALVDAVGRVLFGTPAVSSLLVVGSMLLVTGALHHDGLMDTADGLLSNRPREEMLAIMRDSRVGAMGALAGSFALLAQWVLLTALPEPVRAGVLVGAPALSRWAVVWAMGQWPYAREGGSVAGQLGRSVTARTLAVATGWALLAWAVALAVLAWPLTRSDAALASWAAFALLAPAAAWGTYRGLARCAAARLGGLTGDVYGAIAVATEVAVLAVAVACVR